MGKLYKRGRSQCWQAYWIDAAGQKQRESTRTTDRAVARLWLSAKESDIVKELAGLPVARATSLGEAVGEYLEAHESPVWCDDWHSTVAYWFRHRLIPFLGGAERNVHEVTRADVEAARSKWLKGLDPDGNPGHGKRGRKPTGWTKVQGPTVNRITTVGSGFYKWATEPGRRYALENPFERHKKFKERRAEPPPMTPTQLDAFVAAIPNPAIRRAATIRLDTSKRPIEIRKMRWLDVDCANRMVRVISAKNGKEHWVPLTERALIAIIQQREDAGDELFAHMPVNVRKSLDHALRETGLARFRWYDLRHYALTDAANNGAYPHDLAEMAGWLGPTQAARYVHPSAERVRVIQDRREAARQAEASRQAQLVVAGGGQK